MSDLRSSRSRRAATHHNVETDCPTANDWESLPRELTAAWGSERL